MTLIALDDRDMSTLEQVRELAAELSLPLLGSIAPADCDALLQLSGSGLQLQPCGADASGPVRVAFDSGAMQHRRRGGQMELLARAVGAGKRPDLYVLDATAGLGRDAFVLADSGCRVLMLERSGVVHALLRDGLERARRSEDDRLRATAARMSLRRAEAAEFIATAEEVPDVIYLDPMFPSPGKRARARKEMFLFQRLLEEPSGGIELLQTALQRARFRVVVKRPLKAAPMADLAPAHSIRGKAVRYDVYTLRKLT